MNLLYDFWRIDSESIDYSKTLFSVTKDEVQKCHYTNSFIDKINNIVGKTKVLIFEEIDRGLVNKLRVVHSNFRWGQIVVSKSYDYFGTNNEKF